MPEDDPRVARVEERVEQLVKRFDRHEDAMQRQFAEAVVAVKDTINGRIAKVEGNQTTLERMFRELIDARLALQEEKYRLTRVIVYAMAGAVLLAFLNFVIGGWRGDMHPWTLPQAPPAHSTKEIRER